MRAIRVGMRRMGVGMLEMQRMWGIRVGKPLNSCFHRVAIASFLSTFNNVSKAFHLPNFESLFLLQFNYFTKLCFKDLNFLVDCSSLIPGRERSISPVCFHGSQA